MARPLVSVILPIWNTGKDLEPGIRSVLDQTQDNLEIVLVNDASTDGSGKICDEWSRKCDRIKVIHKARNEGLNMARATGFQSSTGDYVAFLDPDDLLHRDAIRMALDELLSRDADVVVNSYAEFSDSQEQQILGAMAAPVSCETRILETKDEIVRYALFGDGNFPQAHHMIAWGKLYRRRLVADADWERANYRSYEDNFWTPPVLARARRIVLLSAPLNFYRRNVRYNSQGEKLGNRLTGNTRNGAPVGYLEFIDLRHGLYTELANQHGVDLTRRLDDYRFRDMWWRLEGLIEAGLLGAENNLDYLGGLWAERKQRDAEVRVPPQELPGIKRSLRILAGSIKRRLLRRLVS